MNSRKLKAHHPNISFGWGNATVSLQTKKIKGLHESYQEVPSAKLMCIEARSETLKLRRIWRLVFHALARGIIAGALKDMHVLTHHAELGGVSIGGSEDQKRGARGGPPLPGAPRITRGFIGSRPSRCNFLRASLRARRMASALSRTLFSDGFS